ncbi:hypothetical protein F4776DRAFT_660734 [Hypoxylon sp. NC0597]|nr:hypothetical protein F4776DRAFT_660734 [Hypoxylon sp. NC0597]
MGNFWDATVLHHVPIFNQELINPITRYGHHGGGKVAFDKLHLLNSRIMLRPEKKDHTSSMDLPVKEIYVDFHYESKFHGFTLTRKSPTHKCLKKEPSDKSAKIAVENTDEDGNTLDALPLPTKQQDEAQGTFRDLHTLYKSKHETKVAALKKSYENHWENKGRGLKCKVDELEENEKLRLSNARGVIVNSTARVDLIITYSFSRAE